MFLRNIMLCLAKHNIHLVCRHIAGHDNVIADALSRVIHDSSFDWIRRIDNIIRVPQEKFDIDSHL